MIYKSNTERERGTQRATNFSRCLHCGIHSDPLNPFIIPILLILQCYKLCVCFVCTCARCISSHTISYVALLLFVCVHGVAVALCVRACLVYMAKQAAIGQMAGGRRERANEICALHAAVARQVDFWSLTYTNIVVRARSNAAHNDDNDDNVYAV